MIRVELVGRRRSPWPKALLSALIVCGGLYWLYHFHYSGSAPSPVTQQEVAPPSPVVEQETAPSPVTQQETTPSPIVQQEPAPSPLAQQETTPEIATAQETDSSSVAQQEANPSPAVVQQEIESSPAAAQETAPSPVAQQEKTAEPVVQQEAVPSPGIEQDTTSSPIQESSPSPIAQRDTTPSPREIAPSKAPSHPAPALQRSTACHQAMQIAQQVPAGIRVASLNCNSAGEYWLEGITPSHTVLREFRLGLQAFPSRVSFSTWWEERALRFSFQGRFVEQAPPPLAALSSGQAEQFLGKVAGWADASGLDSLSIHEPIHKRSAPARIQQRQKLRGIGAPQQIDAFLQQFQQAEGVATLGEVLLMPVESDEHGWVKARLYAAVDIVVDAP